MNSFVVPLRGWRLNLFPFKLIWRERITPPPDWRANARRYLYGVALWGSTIIIGIVRTVEIPKSQKSSE